MPAAEEAPPNGAAQRGWLAAAERFVLNIFAVLVILLMAAIVVQVVCTQFDVNPIVAFDKTILLLGDAISLNSLLELQWHALALIALLPAGLVLLRDEHVRVDFFYAKLPTRGKAAIDLTGACVFAIPFLVYLIPAAWTFMESAYRFGEKSKDEDGLRDLFLIKSMLPIGLGLLALAVLIDAALQARRLVRG